MAGAWRGQLEIQPDFAQHRERNGQDDAIGVDLAGGAAGSKVSR